jgi:hypothetical protein
MPKCLHAAKRRQKAEAKKREAEERWAFWKREMDRLESERRANEFRAILRCIL